MRNNKDAYTKFIVNKYPQHRKLDSSMNCIYFTSLFSAMNFIILWVVCCSSIVSQKAYSAQLLTIVVC